MSFGSCFSSVLGHLLLQRLGVARVAGTTWLSRGNDTTKSFGVQVTLGSIRSAFEIVKGHS